MTSPFARCLWRNLFTLQRSFTRNNHHRLLYNTVRSNFLRQQVIYKPKYVVNLFSTNKADINKTIKNIAPKKLGLFKRFKLMYKHYWYVLIPVHIVTTIGWISGFYYMASSGMDIAAIMQSMGFSERIVNQFKKSCMGHIAVTVALFKIATPFRYAVTLGGTTVSINYLKEWGYIKPVDEVKGHIKESIQETKMELKHRKDQSRRRQDNIKGDYATFKKELKYFITKMTTKVAKQR